MKKVYISFALAVICFLQVHAQVLLHESFDNANLPNNWAHELGNSNTNGWKIMSSSTHSVSSPHSGENFIEFESYITEKDLVANLISPAINVADKNYKLEFYSVVAPNSYGLHLDISTDNGATWIEDILFVNNAENQWTLHSVDISKHLPCGQLKVRFRAKSSYGNGKCSIALDDIRIFKPKVMRFTSATTEQNNRAFISSGEQNAEVIAIKISTTGELNPLTMSQFTCNTTGCSSTSDISKAKIYYTGTSATFATTSSFGTVDAPNGQFSINGSQTLEAGDNYFWLVYEIAPTAMVENVIDAQCESFVLNENNYVPTNTNPEGNRTLKNIVLLQEGYNTKKVLFSTLLYDDGGATENYSENFSGILTLEPKNESHKIELEFLSFESSNYHKLQVYNGRTASGTPLAELKGNIDTKVIKSTSEDGCLTIEFTSSEYNIKKGWEAKVTNYKPATMRYVASSAFQDNLSSVSPGSKNQEIIGYTIETEGLLNALVAEKVKLNLSSSTTIADIQKAVLYYSASKEFGANTCEKVAELSEITASEIEFTLNKSLAIGKNHFWIAFDINNAAKQNNTIDAAISKLTISGSEYIPTNSSPEGKRIVKRIYNLTSSSDITTSGGLFYDDGGADSYYSNNFEGTIVFRPENVNNKIRIKFLSLDIETATTCNYDYLQVFDGENLSAPELGKYCGTTLPPVLTSTATDGSLCVYFKSDGGSNKGGWVAEVSEYKPEKMSFETSNSFLYSSAGICAGAQTEPIVGVKINTSGSLNPLVLNKLKVDTKNTENISKISIYSTGKSDVFNRDNLLASVPTNTSIQEVAVNQQLLTGDNHLWVSYDVDVQATAGELVNAEVINVTIGEETHLNTMANLTGRTVEKSLLMPNSEGNVVFVDSEINFYDDGGKDELHSKNSNGRVSFVPADPNKKVKLIFDALDLQNYGVDFHVFNGKTETDNNEIISIKGSELPQPIKSTANDGALHVYFKSSPSFSQKPGWSARVVAYEPKSLSLKSSIATQNQRRFLQRNTEDQEILGVQLATEGETESVRFSKMTFNTLGCTRTTDITKAKLYYTNDSEKFKDAELLGTVNSPNGDFSFTFDKEVDAEKTYYFWLCFDIANDAIPNNEIDAILKSVTANAKEIKATQGDPIGKRVVRKALSGIYSVNNDLSTTADFSSLTEVTDALDLLGVNDPVTFNIANGTYNETLTLGEISGANNSNKITFTSATQTADDVKITWKGTSSAQSVLKMNGTDYVRFQHVSFLNKGSKYCINLELFGEANHNEFLHNNFEGCEVKTIEYDDNKILILSAGSDRKSIDNHNHFIGNTFKFGKMAFNYQGVDAVSEFEQGTVIKENTFIDQFFKSVYLNYQDNCNIEGNTFTLTEGKKEFQAIDIFQSHKNLQIVKNHFQLNFGSKGGTAIFLRDINSVDASTTLIANNSIDVKSSNSAAIGIELNDIDYVNIYHNTIKVGGSATYSKALYIDKRSSSAMDALKIKNNIFSMYSDGFAIWAKAQGTNTVFANNNYFTSNSSNYIKYGSLSVTTLADWKAAIDDENSIAAAPDFVSETDLHVSGMAMKFGTQIDEITNDIDGEARNAAAPFIGADEIPDATFAGGYPKFMKRMVDGAQLALQIGEVGTAHFVVLAKGSPLPSVQQIKNGKNATGSAALFSNSVSLLANQETTTTVNSLEEKTTYDLVVVVEKENGKYSAVLKLRFSTLDVTPPAFTNQTPQVVERTDSYLRAIVELNESGLVYYALYPSNIVSLTAKEVKKGISSIASGQINADKERYIRCSELLPGTEYSLFIVAEDKEESPNLQANAVKLNVKTLFKNAIQNFTANAQEGTQVQLQWQQTSKPSNVMVCVSSSPDFATPIAGTAYSIGEKIDDKTAVLYKGNASSFVHTAVELGKKYYYRIYTYNSENEYSHYLQNYAVTTYDNWTILVYLDGDNNLEGNAIKDINEMEAVELPDGVNLIVQIDRTPGHDYSNNNWTETRRYKIQHDTDTRSIGSLWLDENKPLGELNMGDQKTLENFMEWGIKSYPAKKTMLIMWDHGGGWRSENTGNFELTKGVCWDDTNGNDYLEMHEVSSAIAAVEAKTKQKLNILGYDVCLAGMMEVAYQTRDVVADYSIFSQALEPGDGWAYDKWLAALVNNPDASSLAVSESIVNTFQESYDDIAEVTLSAMDMSKVNALKVAIDEFANQYLSAQLESSVVEDAFNASDLFSARKNYIDLGLFAKYCSENLTDKTTKQKAQQIKTILDDAIVAKGNTSIYTHSTGLNIYFHKYDDYEWEDYRAPYCDFAEDGNWKWFIKNYNKDGKAPSFMDGYPKAANISNQSFDLVLKANKTGKAYLIIQENDLPTPTVAQVKAGKNGNDVTLENNRKAIVDLTKYIITTESIEALQENTTYNIFFVLEDNNGVSSTTPIFYTTTTINRQVATFEKLPIANEAFWNGADNSGGFTDGGFFFQNYYSSVAWSGFAYSNRTDITQESITGQFTSYAGGGAENSSAYGVGYVVGSFSRLSVSNAGNEGIPVSGLYVSNNNWAYYSMKKGDIIAKKFGGESGNDPDWFKLTVRGIDANGQLTGDVEFYLADFRAENSADDYIVEDWKWLDLTSLGNVAQLEFRLSSSDNGQYGMNTPAYFCIDNLNGDAPQDHAPIVASPIADVVVKKNAPTKTISLASIFTDEDGDRLQYTVKANSNTSLVTTQLKANKLELSFVENQSGKATITIEAEANGKTAETSFNVTVNNVDNAPIVVAQISNIEVNTNAEAQYIDLSTVFSDPDNDPLSYTISSNTNTELVIARLNKNKLEVAFGVNKSGKATLTIQAEAGGKKVKTSFNVTVNQLDRSPILLQKIEDITVEYNAEDLQIDLASHFNDADGDAITYSVSLSKPDELVTADIIGETLHIGLLNGKHGEVTVTVSATANQKTVSTSFLFTVNRSTTSISSDNETNWKTYPNPFTNRITIDAGIYIIEQIMVLNTAGNIIYNTAPNQSRITLDWSNKPKGLYLISVTVNGKKHTKQVLKQ